VSTANRASTRYLVLLFIATLLGRRINRKGLLSPSR